MKIQEKISGLLMLYFLCAMIAISSTLYVSWRLEGGAAAINEAGSERMRSYHIAFLLAQHVQHPSPALRREVEDMTRQFERVLFDLERGDPNRPLSLPKEDAVRIEMQQLRQRWESDIKLRIGRLLSQPTAGELAEYRVSLDNFVMQINALVLNVEQDNAHATTLLRAFQIGLVSLALIGTVVLMSLFTLVVTRPVRRLQEGLQRMSKADFAVRLPVTSRDEFGELAKGFNQMASELQDGYATLEQRVAEKSHDIEMQSRELAAHDKEKAISDERNLLAQELHDSIAQSLAYLNIQVQLLYQDELAGHHDRVLEGLAQIREGVQESYDDVRELLVHFRTRLGDTDLQTAVSNALNKFEGQTGITTQMVLHGDVPSLRPEQMLQVMHIVHESLSNVRKHAHASKVAVILNNTGQFHLDIQDNGKGFDVHHDAGDIHVGLRIMRERAHRIGATLTFASTERGTTVSCHLEPKKDAI